MSHWGQTRSFSSVTAKVFFFTFLGPCPHATSRVISFHSPFPMIHLWSLPSTINSHRPSEYTEDLTWLFCESTSCFSLLLKPVTDFLGVIVCLPSCHPFSTICQYAFSLPTRMFCLSAFAFQQADMSTGCGSPYPCRLFLRLVLRRWVLMPREVVLQCCLTFTATLSGENLHP